RTCCGWRRRRRRGRSRVALDGPAGGWSNQGSGSQGGPMPRHDFDKGSKRLIGTHGNAVLYLGGARQVTRWRALQAEVVQPRQLPDGLLEVFFAGRKKPDYFLLEVATYPEARVLEQALDDLTLTYQTFRQMPELLILVLHPKGQAR